MRCGRSLERKRLSSALILWMVRIPFWQTCILLLQANTVQGSGCLVGALGNFTFLDYFIVECEGAAFLRHDPEGGKYCNGKSNTGGQFIFLTFNFSLLLFTFKKWSVGRMLLHRVLLLLCSLNSLFSYRLTCKRSMLPHHKYLEPPRNLSVQREW